MQFIRQSVGTYTSADGRVSIRIYPIQDQYLGMETLQPAPDVTVPTSLFRFRLMSVVENGFVVNDGASSSDAIRFETVAAGEISQLVYFSFQGYDSNGKPQFEKNVLSKK